MTSNKKLPENTQRTIRELKGILTEIWEFCTSEYSRALLDTIQAVNQAKGDTK